MSFPFFCAVGKFHPLRAFWYPGHPPPLSSLASSFLVPVPCQALDEEGWAQPSRRSAQKPQRAQRGAGWGPAGTCRAPGWAENNELIKDEEDVQGRSSHPQQGRPTHDPNAGL